MTACPGCNALDASPRFSKDGVAYYLCRHCELTFGLAPGNANLDPVSVHEFEPARMDYLRETTDDRDNLSKLVQRVEAVQKIGAGSVLDVGCGSGKLVRFLRERGIEAYGVEPSGAIFEHFLSGQPDFYHGLLEDVRPRLPRNRFDVIFGCDVIEHVLYPQTLVSQAAELLVDDGRLVITTPNTGSALARLLGRHWHHYNRYHFSLFTRKSLLGLATEHGFCEVEYAALGRTRRVGYALRYLNDFVLGTLRLPVPDLFDRVVVPINLYDTMYVCFRRTVRGSKPPLSPL